MSLPTTGKSDTGYALLTLKADDYLQNLSEFDHIAFTSRNGIHAVFQMLARLHGSKQAAVQAVQNCKACCWALGADADLLTQLGVLNVQTPEEVETRL